MHKNISLALFFLLLGGTLFFSMPKWLYSGDPIAIRTSSVSIIENGHFGVPFRDKKHIEKFLLEEHSYFIKNKEELRYYPKWGPAGPLIYTLPLLIEKTFTENLSYLHAEERFILILNIFNLGATLILSIYLFAFLGQVFAARAPRFATLLATLFATFLWHYTRAQSLEIFLCLFYCAYVYHFYAYARDPMKTRHLLFSSINIIILFLLKNYFLLLVPLKVLSLLALHQKQLGALKNNIKPLLWNFVLPLGAGVILLLVSNNIRFGSWLATGYETNAQIYANFAGNPLTGWWGYIASPRYSMFTHFPVLLFGLMGLKLVYNKSPFLCFFLGIHFFAFGSLFSCLENWAGEWAYGPRLILFSLVPLSLFFCALLNQIFGIENKVKRWGIALAIGMVMLASGFLQERVNRFPFFISYLVEQRIDFYTKHTNLLDYFQNTPVPIFAHELNAFKNGEKLFYPFIEMDGKESPESMKNLARDIKPLLKQNYYWLD